MRALARVALLCRLNPRRLGLDAARQSGPQVRNDEMRLGRDRHGHESARPTPMARPRPRRHAGWPQALADGSLAADQAPSPSTIPPAAAGGCGRRGPRARCGRPTGWSARIRGKATAAARDGLGPLGRGAPGPRRGRSRPPRVVGQQLGRSIGWIIRLVEPTAQAVVRQPACRVDGLQLVTSHALPRIASWKHTDGGRGWALGPGLQAAMPDA